MEVRSAGKYEPLSGLPTLQDASLDRSLRDDVMDLAPCSLLVDQENPRASSRRMKTLAVPLIHVRAAAISVLLAEDSEADETQAQLPSGVSKLVAPTRRVRML